MKNDDDFHTLKWEEKSGFKVGESSDLIKLYQDMVQTNPTGVWTADDEAHYIEYAEQMNWKIILEVIKAPSFWDLCLDEGELLDLEF